MQRSPYILPDGPVVIAFSGGRTSAYLLFKIIEANHGLPATVYVIFTNTGREMNETLDFVQECASRWGIRIIWIEYRCEFTGAPHDPKNKIFDSAAHTFVEVNHNSASRNGEPFEHLCRYFRRLPNIAGDFCSHELKTRTTRRYCVDVLGLGNWTVAIGMRHDEKKRALKKQPKERYRVWYPLIDAKVTKRDVSDFWKKMPFNLGLQDINGVTPLGNCCGCFKKSEWKRSVLARDYPDRAAWWLSMEEKYKDTFRASEPWAETVDFVARQGDWIFDAENDALCQKDGGECSAFL